MSTYFDGYNDGLSGSRPSPARSWLNPAYAKGYKRGRSERSQVAIAKVICGIAITTVALLTGFLGTGVI